MDRVKSGIDGLDELIEGGFPKGRTVLVSGGCGTGKSIFGLQFLYKGALAGEAGVYVTLDERPEIIREDMMRFGWDLRSLEDAGKLIILDLTSTKLGVPSEERYAMNAPALDLDRLILKIMQTASEIGAKRIVVDSIPALGFHLKDENEARNMILKLTYMIRKSSLTAVLVSEVPEQSPGSGPMKFSKYGVEEYVADAVILLHYLGIGSEGSRTLYIRKMRGTKHAEDIIPLKITDAGMKLTNPEEAFRV
ncbi:MAG: AAA family ATPase [Candidatus Diapherotrites archaeon]|nr:AAA family ATPase [Candidatus Diapherotrites archaeon]